MRPERPGATRRRTRPRRSGPLTLTRTQARVFLRRLQPQRGREPSARDVGLVVDGNGDRSRLELAHDLAEQLRDHRDTRLVDLRGYPDAVGDLEVGPDELDPVGVGGDPKVGQHGKRARTTGNGTLHRRDGLREGVPLAVELHYRSPVIRAERSRCLLLSCGLCTQERIRRSGTDVLVHGRPQPSPGFHTTDSKRASSSTIPARYPQLSTGLSTGRHSMRRSRSRAIIERRA